MGKKQTDKTSTACPLGHLECKVDEQLESLAREINQLKKQVSTDPLTGLFNVRHMRFALEQEMERTRRSHQATTVILLDVDHFKKFNDTYGHVVGDHVLIHLASLIKTTIRKIDVPCRYGGEEFMVILPSTPLLVGRQVAERIRLAVEQQPLKENDRDLYLTISAGVDTYLHNHGDDLSTLIDRVDKQLYNAKASGRNRVNYNVDQPEQKASVSTDEKEALFNQLWDKD